MNVNEPRDQTIFKTGTAISEPVSWLSSIRRQLRLRREERDAPRPEITANPDPEALKILVKSRSVTGSLIWTIRDIFADRNRVIETTATPVEVPELWEKDNSGYSGLFSVGAHVLVILILLIPAVKILGPESTATSVIMLSEPPLILNLPEADSASGGGGGGGLKAPTPPSKGELPRGDDKQLLPPAVEIKNLAPDLVVEPTVVAPQLANLTPLPTMTFGDPNGIVGPPSAGPGTGGGIGTGTGTGIGPGKGPGVGEGEGGGIGGGVYSVGGGVSQPTPVFTPQPEYSEDGRKGRIQGTVELIIIVNADGTVKFEKVNKSLGYGLDQKAIEAVRTWKFIAAKKDGKPVATYVSVLVNFSLR